MNALAVYLLATFGLCYILGHSRLSLVPRVLAAGVAERSSTVPRHLITWTLNLIECPACLGFWLGLAAGATGAAPWPLVTTIWLNALGWAFATCGAHYLLASWTGWINEGLET